MKHPTPVPSSLPVSTEGEGETKLRIPLKVIDQGPRFLQNAEISPQNYRMLPPVHYIHTSPPYPLKGSCIITMGKQRIIMERTVSLGHYLRRVWSKVVQIQSLTP